MNLAELIEIPESIEGGRRALTYLGRSLTYEEMVGATHSAAGKLRDRGFGPASRVAVVDINNPAQALTLVALARLDAIGVPVNSRASAGELGAMLDAGHVDALVAGDSCIQLAEAAAAQTRAGLPVLVTDPWCSGYRPLGGERPASSGHRAADGGDSEAEPGDRTVLQLFTSGTVSTPKPFSYTNEALTSYVA